MMITDWDDAYRNGAYIDGADGYPPRWAADAGAFRTANPPRALAYGDHPRMVLDLFTPPTAPRGLAVFVHGGYWMAFGRETWSHLAAGALNLGYAVAIPSYVLAPEARIYEITRQIARAIDVAAGEIAGQIHLAGHSAGGHLVSRMMCEGAPLAAQSRLKHVLSISGLHDLRPLLNTTMNKNLRLDMAEAEAESAALLRPTGNAKLTTWVGADERPEFIRQSELLANIWTGLGVECASIFSINKHHFNVIDDLANPNSTMIQEWLA